MVSPFASRLSPRSGLDFERGDGVWLTTTDGQRYLDFGGGIAVASLGYSHPHLVAALTEQAGKLWHTSNLHMPPGGERLAQRLVDATFADVVFFTNSGAEANEAAIKMARKYHAAHGPAGALSTSSPSREPSTAAPSPPSRPGGQQKYIEGFGPKVEGFDQVPFGDLEAAEAAIGPETAAIMIEPIQGEGGVRVIPTEQLRALPRACATSTACS